MRNCHLFILAVLTFPNGCDDRNDSAHSKPTTVEQADLMEDDTTGWQEMWDARLAVFEKEFGDSEDMIATSPVPIYLDGGADVLTFKHHVDGVAYVTAGLILEGRQKKTELGEYELMMCLREENDWTPSLLSRLAPYTFESALNPGDTMDIAQAMPEGSTITGLLYLAYRQFKVKNVEAGVLLCIGVTQEELRHCREHGHLEVLAQLKKKGIYPYTVTHRDSVLP